MSLQIAFSVPSYPVFRHDLAGVEERKYERYLERFERYACSAIRVQANVATSVGTAKYMKDEVVELKKVAADMCSATLSSAEHVAGKVVEEFQAIHDKLNVATASQVVAESTVCADNVDRMMEKVSEEFVKLRSEVIVERKGECGELLETEVRGKHYLKNKHKKEAKRKRAKMASSWRTVRNGHVDSNGGCVSDGSTTGTAHTVDSCTAADIEAARTLAVRRVVENKLAIAQGNAKLRGFGDKSKTEALAKLTAARIEQRINEAKAKSQANYKQCDESLKSLGSSGSAGEYALKQHIKDARQDRALLKYVEAQAALLAKHASPEVLAAVAAMPPPVFENEHDTFGECPSDYDEDEQFAYYRDLDRRQLEQDEACLSFSPF